MHDLNVLHYNHLTQLCIVRISRSYISSFKVIVPFFKRKMNNNIAVTMNIESIHGSERTLKLNILCTIKRLREKKVDAQKQQNIKGVKQPLLEHKFECKSCLDEILSIDAFM